MTCGGCGAANPDDAAWCGLCLRRFGAPLPVRAGTTQAPAAPPSGGGDSAGLAPAQPADLSRTVPIRLVATESGPIRRAGDRLEWTCSRCGRNNAIEDYGCVACGMSMLDLFRHAGTVRPSRDPARATLLSLLLPGLGSWYAGMRPQALSRLFIWLLCLGTSVALWSNGPVRFAPVAALFALATAAAWALAATDARRAAAGRPALLPARVLALAVAALFIVLSLSLLLGVMLVATHPGALPGR